MLLRVSFLSTFNDANAMFRSQGLTLDPFCSFFSVPRQLCSSAFLTMTLSVYTASTHPSPINDFTKFLWKALVQLWTHTTVRPLNYSDPFMSLNSSGAPEEELVIKLLTTALETHWNNVDKDIVDFE